MLQDAMTQNAELRQMIERLTRKLDYLYRSMGVQYPDDDLPLYVLEAREYVLQNRDAEAIKVVREHTAVGILEARAIVDDMRRRLARTPAADASGAPRAATAPAAGNFDAWSDVPTAPAAEPARTFDAWSDVPTAPAAEPARNFDAWSDVPSPAGSWR